MKSVAAKYILGFIWVVVLGAIVSSAQSKRVDIKFSPGTSSGTYANTLTGYGNVDFYVKASAGQEMSVKLNSTKTFLYFVVLKDPESMEAVADGARETTEWSGKLPADSTYIVRVYLVRAEARRSKRAVKFTLDIGVR
jgi:hypothetical protein